MATLTKTYRIQIQLEDAQQQLAAATAKLEALDQQLQGLDRNSEVGKALVAEMAKAAKEVEDLTRQVGGLGDELAGLQPVKPGTLAALKQEAEELEAALQHVDIGSEAYDELIRKLGQVRAELKDTEERIDVTFDKDKAGAYVDAVNGLAGAGAVALVAAQNFGLSDASAQKYEQRLSEIIAVTGSLEQIHKLTTAEVSTALKGLWGDTKRVVLGYFGIGQATTAAGTAATASANVTRIALASLGIGLVLVVLGLVVANWDRITAAVKRNKDEVVKVLGFVAPQFALLIRVLDQIEKKFGSLSAFVAGLGAAVGQAFRNLGNVFAGAEGQGKTVAEAFHEGVVKRNAELAKERERELLKPIIARRAERIAILEAEGRDTTALRARQLADEIKSMQVSTKEELAEMRKKYTELRVLEASYNKQRADEARKARHDELSRQIAETEAAGRDAYALKVRQLEQDIQLLDRHSKTYAQDLADKQSQLRVLAITHERELTQLQQQADLDRLRRHLAATEAEGQDTYALREAILQLELRQLDQHSKTYANDYANKLAEIRLLRIKHEQELTEEQQKAAVERAKAFGGTAQEVLRAEITGLVTRQTALLLQGKRYESEWLALQTQIREKEQQIGQLNLADRKRELDERQRLQDDQLAREAEQEDIRLARLRRGGVTQRQLDEEMLKGLKARAQQMAEFGRTGSKAYSDLLDSINELEKKLKPQALTLGQSIVKSLFNLSDEKAKELAAKLTEEFGKIQQAAQLANDTLFALAQDKVEAQIERYSAAMDAAKGRADQAEQEMDAARQRREALEQQVDQARGARRQYLIEQIAKERAAEERAARQKAAADAEEMKNARLKEAAEKRKQELERKSQILAQTTTAITTAATAAEAVRAAVMAVRSGAGVGFPANLIAIVTALAAVGAAIASAKQLGNTIKGAEGGLLEGPSHNLGGIRGTGRFANVEVEGKEMLIKRSATLNNLGTLATINRYGDRIQFVAVPKALVKGETGGQLGTTGGLNNAQAGDATSNLSLLSSAQGNQIIALLAEVAGHAQRTADKPAVTFDGPTSRRVLQRGQQEIDDMNSGKLFG